MQVYERILLYTVKILHTVLDRDVDVGKIRIGILEKAIQDGKITKKSISIIAEKNILILHKTQVQYSILNGPLQELKMYLISFLSKLQLDSLIYLQRMIC